METADRLSAHSRAVLAAARATLESCDPRARLNFLISMWTSGTLRADDWLRLLGDELTSCADLDVQGDLLWNITPLGLSTVTPGLRELLMNNQEVAVFNALPDNLPLFRACRTSNKWGLCWRLDQNAGELSRAVSEATEDDPAVLVTARARKDQVAALKIEPQRLTIIAMRPKHVSTARLTQPSAKH